MQAESRTEVPSAALIEIMTEVPTEIITAVSAGKVRETAAPRAAETVREAAVSRGIVRAARETGMVRPEAAIRAAETVREAATSRETARTASLADETQLPAAGLHLTRMEAMDVLLVEADPVRAISSAASSRAVRALPAKLPAKTARSIEKKRRGVSARRKISVTARIICMKRKVR